MLSKTLLDICGLATIITASTVALDDVNPRVHYEIELRSYAG